MATPLEHAPSPRGPEESNGLALRAFAHVVRALAAVGIVVWFVPELPRALGFGDVLRPLLRSRVLWMAALPALLVSMGVAHAWTGAPRRRRLAETRERQARELGGELRGGPGLDAAGRLPAGPELGVPVGARTMSVTTVIDRSGHDDSRETRATVTLETSDLFGFVAIAHGHPANFVGALIGAGFASAVREASKRAKTDAERRSLASLEYLSAPPIRPLPGDVADLMTLRTNDPARAGAFFGASGVSGALRELDRLAPRWQWSLYPAKQLGRMELTMHLPGSVRDTEVLRAVQALQTAALDAIDRARAA